MPVSFWIRRFLTVLLGAFAIIAISQRLRGHAWPDVVLDAACWATISAALFVAARYWQSRRGRHCALCRDTPELR
jgi:hypothetical protein